MLQSTGLQRVRHDRETEQKQQSVYHPTGSVSLENCDIACSHTKSQIQKNLQYLNI